MFALVLANPHRKSCQKSFFMLNYDGNLGILVSDALSYIFLLINIVLCEVSNNFYPSLPKR